MTTSAPSTDPSPAAKFTPYHATPIGDMYGRLAVMGPRSLRDAFATVRDSIEMGILPPEILADVVLGRRTISSAMSDLAEVMADSAADCDDQETREGMDQLVADCSAAARVLA